MENLSDLLIQFHSVSFNVVGWPTVNVGWMLIDRNTISLHLIQSTNCEPRLDVYRSPRNFTLLGVNRTVRTFVNVDSERFFVCRIERQLPPCSMSLLHLDNVNIATSNSSRKARQELSPFSPLSERTIFLVIYDGMLPIKLHSLQRKTVRVVGLGTERTCAQGWGAHARIALQVNGPVCR
jgi:hypothetical protein